MAARLKQIALAVALFAAFAGIGILAVKGSGYMDVSELVRLEHPAKVTVQGRLVQVDYDPEARKIYLVLEGRDGSKVLAVVDADYVERKYGPIQYLKWSRDRVVVMGVYEPAEKTLKVLEILEGCHSTYEQPAVTG